MSIDPAGNPPPEPWHRRYWGYYNRPYPGFGCIWTVALVIIAWWVIAAVYSPARFGWW